MLTKELEIGMKVMVLRHCLISEARDRIAKIVGIVHMRNGILYELSINTTTGHPVVVWDDEIERCEVW